MNTQNGENNIEKQKLEDISSVLGALSMSQAKLDDTYMRDLFDLDIDIDAEDSAPKENKKILQ